MEQQTRWIKEAVEIMNIRFQKHRKMTCRLLNINLLANIGSPGLSFQATKFTAPTFRQHSRKKYGLDRKRNTFNKQPKRMDTAKVKKFLANI